MAKWTLEANYPDGLERASFKGREQALEHAMALVNDYGEAVKLTLIDPNGKANVIEDPASKTNAATD
jgi:cobalamin-dependent methionine synthase I